MSSIRTPQTTPLISFTFGFNRGASAKNVSNVTLESIAFWSCLPV
jgi:hypothetical protein